MFVNATRTLNNSQPLIAQCKDAWDGRFETSVGHCIQPRHKLFPLLLVYINFT